MDKKMLINVIETHLMRINTTAGGDIRQEFAAIYEVMLDLAKLIEDVK